MPEAVHDGRPYPRTELAEHQRVAEYLASRVDELAREVDARDRKIADLESENGLIAKLRAELGIERKNTRDLADALSNKAKECRALFERYEKRCAELEEMRARAEKAEAALKVEEHKSLDFIANANVYKAEQDACIRELQAKLAKLAQAKALNDHPPIIKLLDPSASQQEHARELDRLVADLKEERAMHTAARSEVACWRRRAESAEERKLALGSWVEQHWDDIPYHRDTLRIAMGWAIPGDQAPPEGAQLVWMGDGKGGQREGWALRSDPGALPKEPRDGAPGKGGLYTQKPWDVRLDDDGTVYAGERAIGTVTAPRPDDGADRGHVTITSKHHGDLGSCIGGAPWRPACGRKPTIVQLIAYWERSYEQLLGPDPFDRPVNLSTTRGARADQLEACIRELRSALVPEPRETTYATYARVAWAPGKGRPTIPMLAGYLVSEIAAHEKLASLDNNTQWHTGYALALRAVVRHLNELRELDPKRIQLEFASDDKEVDRLQPRGLNFAVEPPRLVPGSVEALKEAIRLVSGRSATVAPYELRPERGEWLANIEGGCFCAVVGETPEYALHYMLRTFVAAPPEPAQRAPEPGSVEALTDACRLIFGSEIAFWPRGEHVAGYEAVLLNDDRGRATGTHEEDALRNLISAALEKGVPAK